MARCNNKSDPAPSVPSKDMARFGNLLGVFVQNQFRTKIPLPTKEDYPDVKGKCAIVTGSNSGLGFAASKQLLELGLSHLIIGVRSLEKGEAAAEKLRSLVSTSTAKIEVWKLDMESYDSIQAFVRKCDEELERLDIVILNAGLSLQNFTAVPSTGHETTIQVNHISTSLLTILMLPVLKAKSPADTPGQLTLVNSVTAEMCKFPDRDQRPLLPTFDNPATWNAEERYGVSKLLNQLFLVRLAELVDPSHVTINMVDPGLTKGTGLSQYATGVLAMGAWVFFNAAGRPVDRGAATYIDACLGHGVDSHGSFLMNCKHAP